MSYSENRSLTIERQADREAGEIYRQRGRQTDRDLGRHTYRDSGRHSHRDAADR
jgi:hypothetical protein